MASFAGGSFVCSDSFRQFCAAVNDRCDCGGCYCDFDGSLCRATVYRFRKIRMLSDYLYKLADGGARFCRKYTEGELSLLQSEIYKLAVRLSEQAELL